MTVPGRAKHYLSALGALAALSVAYQLVITPALQAPDVTPVVAKPTTEVGDMYESLADLFPRDAWQCGDCKHLQSSGGMLLFKELEQISDNQWKLSPVTVVIGRGMSADPSPNPVIVDAPEGAEITFTESLDVMSGSAPPIHRGRMIGAVNIRRRGDGDGRDTLQVRTSNVGIDGRKIWTTEAIEMEMGKAQLSGRDLTLHFANVATNPDSPAVLDRMELIYLDQLIMPLENGGLLSATDAPRATPALRAELSVFCGGRLEYDFAIDQLSMRESVSLVHQLQGQPADYFECDVLNLKLRDPTNDSIVRNSPFDWLSRIVATGSPARAVLPSFDAELDADVIDLDALKGLVRAQGRRVKENGKTVVRAVRIRRGAIEALLAQLIYQFDPQQPDAIGMVDVQGAGIVTVTDPESPLVRARWRDGFKLQPTSVTTAKDFNSKVEVMIDGEVEAHLSDGGKFSAESVAGLFKPVSEVDPKTGRRKTTLVPSWFEARQGVSIDTSALAAQTQRLELFFVAPPASER